MENKIVNVKMSEKNRNAIEKYKRTLECRSFDEVITRILGIITKFKLSKELDIKEYTG